MNLPHAIVRYDGLPMELTRDMLHMELEWRYGYLPMVTLFPDEVNGCKTGYANMVTLERAQRAIAERETFISELKAALFIMSLTSGQAA